MGLENKLSVRGSRRRGFTLIELMLAGMITALVAAAGASLIFATTGASRELGGIRNTKTAGNYALSQIASRIRQARAIGDLRSNQLSLWVEDANGDDVANLNEIATIRYRSGEKTITYLVLDPARASGSFVVPEWVLTSAPSSQQMISMGGPQPTVWADDVETFSFSGYPQETDTRIVEVRFTIGQGAGAISFQTTASPRAPADYLFVPEAKATPPPGSSRAQRSLVSPWDGLNDLAKLLDGGAPMNPDEVVEVMGQ
ncbi:MAG: type II secretion system protein [Planctomycetota bacterium]|nr:type II secretion system protein [Planctomycetota bacterium]